MEILRRAILVRVIGFVAVLTLALVFLMSPRPSEQISCTQEARQCPDGSYVGRTGPRCEFAPCPDALPNDGSVTFRANLGETVSALGVTVTPEEVLEDSRCPADVVCVWAGRVRIRAMLGSGLGEAPQIFVLGEPITTEAEEVTLIGVEPGTSAGVTIMPQDYRFVFTVKKRVL